MNKLSNDIINNFVSILNNGNGESHDHFQLVFGVWLPNDWGVSIYNYSATLTNNITDPIKCCAAEPGDKVLVMLYNDDAYVIGNITKNDTSAPVITTSNGWHIIEYSDGYCELTKKIEINNAHLDNSEGEYKFATVAENVEFPYGLITPCVDCVPNVYESNTYRQMPSRVSYVSKTSSSTKSYSTGAFRLNCHESLMPTYITGYITITARGYRSYD